MKRIITKTLTILLTGTLAISCAQTVVSNHSDNDQYKSVDRVTVYQDDQSDSIPKDKIVYQVSWGNTPDSLKPKFDINFCKDNFYFPYYFPNRDQLNGKPEQTFTIIENEHLEVALPTTITMNYDKEGRIKKYSVSGPSTIYSCDFQYDSQNRIRQISDGWKKISFTYNSFDNLEMVKEINSDKQTSKSLQFDYTYIAFQRH